ncbi:c-type cytochrome [Gilvimarinus sp. F26214L]|uniref:c-type cytochrome n=1 Tax=Gilvimarinus sp. DZF01 TaxID=3461371 RepID=UPI00404647D0
MTIEVHSKRPRTAAMSAALWAALLLPGFSVFGQAASAAESDTARFSEGREAYEKVCRYCHETAVAPALLGRELEPSVVEFFVRNGNRAMPAFRAAEINDQVLSELTEYIAEN